MGNATTGGGVSTTNTATDQSNADTLVSMGFQRNQVIIALQASANNLEAALELLTEQQAAEERIRRASAAEKRISSSQIKKPVPVSKASSQPQPPVRPVQASASSFSASLGTFVDLLTPISDRPEALDTLHYVLRTIRDNPSEPKYRSIKTTNARFQKTLAIDPRTADRVESFMKRVGFDRAGEWLMLSPSSGLESIREAIRAIEFVQSGPVYTAAKRNLEFERAIELSKASADEEELKRRALFASKVPVTPPEGAAGTTRITIVVSEGAPPLSRRFASDDVLLDIVHWIGSERSVVCSKILDGAWSLVDETFLQKKALDVLGADGSKSLQALGLWPSATLHVRLNHHM